jgi:hypothetical protein
MNSGDLLQNLFIATISAFHRCWEMSGKLAEEILSEEEKTGENGYRVFAPL